MRSKFNLLIVDEDSSSFEAVKLLIGASEYADEINVILVSGGKTGFDIVWSDYIDLLFIARSCYSEGLYDKLFRLTSLSGGVRRGYVVVEHDNFLLLASSYEDVGLLGGSSTGSMSELILERSSFFSGIIERYYRGCCMFVGLGEGENGVRGAGVGSRSFHSIVAGSEEMSGVFKGIAKAGESDSPVLILGESGTGKELVAEAIHKSSVYSRGSFVAINCTAIPKDLIESELFGHKKGSFTGAIRDKPGYFLEANKGTLFLDEIGDLSFDLQVKLLRVLETKEIRPVGGDRVRKVDLRIISATHRDLKDYIDRGRFREDLYFRLNTFSISIPPLRERKGDIPLLAAYFLDNLNKKYGGGKHLSRRALSQLISYSWRGNVRELKNIMERLFLYSDEDLIGFVPEDMFQFKTVSSDYLGGGSSVGGGKILSLAEGERNIIHTVLNNSSNITESAKLLGISRDTLYRKMKRYNISYFDDKHETRKV